MSGDVWVARFKIISVDGKNRRGYTINPCRNVYKIIKASVWQYGTGTATQIHIHIFRLAIITTDNLMHVCHGSWRYDEIVVTLSPVGKQYNELMHSMRMMNWWRRQWNGMRNFFVAKWHEKNASVATSVPLLNVFRTRISSNCFEHGWEWRMTWRYLVPGNCMHTINRKCHISGLNGLCELCRMPRTLIDWNCVSRRKKKLSNVSMEMLYAEIDEFSKAIISTFIVLLT